MKNLFTGAKITFNEALIDNSKHNQMFDRDGFRQFMLPAKESSIERVERELNLRAYGAKFEREFTNHKNGVITMYISGKIPAMLRDELASLDLLTLVSFGSMKADATFKAK
jgi:hypothetical protein